MIMRNTAPEIPRNKPTKRGETDPTTTFDMIFEEAKKSVPARMSKSPDLMGVKAKVPVEETYVAPIISAKSTQNILLNFSRKNIRARIAVRDVVML